MRPGNGWRVQDPLPARYVTEFSLEFVYSMSTHLHIYPTTDSTVFTFSCLLEATNPVISAQENFSIPENTWGIVIDDSRIQRKLMDRFLSSAGIKDSRKVVLGATMEEVYGFGDTVTNVDLTAAIATHKERHKKDPTAIMTILFKQVGAS